MKIYLCMTNNQKATTVPALDIHTQTDRQTDGRICDNNIALCVHCMLTRDKN